MPQDGESPLARMARAIAEGNGFALGTASLSEDGAAAELPVFRTREKARAYALADEVAGRVSAVDPGRIDRLRVQNESTAKVFLPPGRLFEGAGTASRGTTAGVVLEPGSTVELEVRCVHPSCPIRPGAVLRLAAVEAPDRVRRALLSRDQGLVWSTVRELAARSDSPSDDLVSVIRDSSVPRGGTEANVGIALSDDYQCGLIRLDLHGVASIEVFDSPESWNSARRLHPHGGPEKAAGFLSIAPETAAQLAKDFLLALAKCELRQMTAQSWTALNATAECTVAGGEVVHLLAFGGADPWVSTLPGLARATGQGTAPATGLGAPGGFSMDIVASGAVGEGDVAAAGAAVPGTEEEVEPSPPAGRPRRRKILASGWDESTFESLEHYSRKEFGGDRSAAMRFLVRHGLRRRGYMGPVPRPPVAGFAAAAPSEEGSSRLDLGRAAAEARIRDFERIAGTDTYADWLRDRARSELERMASSEPDDGLRETAQSALDRAAVPPPAPEVEEPSPEEAIPIPSPVDIRPLLRRAFSASAAGQYADALQRLDEVLQAEPTNRTALLGRAVALRRSGKAPEALAALDLVLRLEPANAAALLNRGRVLQEMGDLPAALETFDRLAAVASNDWDVWVARGDVLARMGRVHDALAAYSEASRRNPDDESLSGKIRALERSRPPPPPSPAARAALPREIQEGQSYLVKEPRPDLSYRMLRSLVVRSVPALVLARQPPSQVRAEHALQGVAVLELTHEPGEDRVAPTSLPALTNAVERFVLENHGRAAILLDGLALLVESNGFRDTALFLARVNEAILPSHATFFVSVAPGDLGEKEAAILERDLRVLE